MKVYILMSGMDFENLLRIQGVYQTLEDAKEGAKKHISWMEPTSETSWRYSSSWVEIQEHELK